MPDAIPFTIDHNAIIVAIPMEIPKTVKKLLVFRRNRFLKTSLRNLKIASPFIFYPITIYKLNTAVREQVITKSERA